MAHWLIERIQGLGDRDFLAQAEQSYTYTDLAEQVGQSLHALQSYGIKAGQTVALSCDYSLHGIAALLALLELRTIIVPIASASSEEAEERKHEAQVLWEVRANPSLSIRECNSAPAEPHALVRQLQDAQSPGIILFSSGSTGTPKAMIHDADQLLARFEKKRPRRHRILIFLLFDHIGGLNTLFNALATGACIIVPESRDPDLVAHAMATHRANLLPASPTFLNLLLMSGATTRHDLSRLRFITYGTEPMPESLLQRLNQSLPNAALIQTFGTSETGISQTISRASDSTLIKFEDPHTETRIVDGELWLRSQSQVLGYLNHDMQRFTEDGWFRTGDLVEEADNGFLRIIGRRQDLINVGGEKVTPSEVESVIMEMPEVADCLVYGEENAITGQNVAAQIVTKDDADTKQLKRAIKKYCREKLSPYKVPARILFSSATNYSERFKKMRIQRVTENKS